MSILKRSISCLALLAGFIWSIPSEAGISKEYLDNSEIESVKQLPIKGIKRIRFKDGVEVYVSNNGRYIFDGEFKDLWLGEDIDNIDVFEAKPFKGSGIDLDEISTIVGTGEDVLVAFVSPECFECKGFIKAVLSNDELLAKYTFKFIFLASSEYGFNVNQAIWCSVDRSKRFKNYYLGNESEISSENNADCSPLGLFTSNSVAKYFGINKLPAILDQKNMIISGSGKMIIDRLENSNGE